MRSCPARGVLTPSYLSLPLSPFVSPLAAAGGFGNVPGVMKSVLPTVLTPLIPISPRYSVRLHQGELHGDRTDCHSVDLLHLPSSLCVLAGRLLHRGEWGQLRCARRRWVAAGSVTGLVQRTRRSVCADTVTASTLRSPMSRQKLVRWCSRLVEQGDRNHEV